MSSNLIYDKFLEELTALTKKYGLVIEGCGCGCPHLTYLHYYNKVYNDGKEDEANEYGYTASHKGETLVYTKKKTEKPVIELKSKTGKLLATINPNKIILPKSGKSIQVKKG